MAAFEFSPSSAVANAQQILQIGSSLLQTITNQRINMYTIFWNDPVNIAAALGTSATAVFQSDAALVGFLGPQLAVAGAPAEVIAAATVGIPAQWQVGFNGDGTVTITASTKLIQASA